MYSACSKLLNNICKWNLMLYSILFHTVNGMNIKSTVLAVTSHHVSIEDQTVK